MIPQTLQSAFDLYALAKERRRSDCDKVSVTTLGPSLSPGLGAPDRDSKEDLWQAESASQRGESKSKWMK